MPRSNPEQIEIKTAKRYKVLIGKRILDKIRELMPEKHIAIVTDSNLYRFYSSQMEKISPHIHVFKAGEESKNYHTLHGIYDFLLSISADRYSTLVGIGGGVVGDLAGFAASTYMRGISLVHVPTSLLAMVDASIGGKTAINYGKLKNIIGTFYQPELVVCDIEFIKTLPEREFNSAMSEVIKYGIIQDENLFRFIEENRKEIKNKDERTLTDMIKRSIKNKAIIVEEDEKEKGKRAILNFGHTLGHALESITGYSTFLHGEAVSIGEVFSAFLSMKMGLIDESDLKRICKLLSYFGLPVHIDRSLDTSELFSIMERDKKTKAGAFRFVLTKGIGRSIIASDLDKSKIMDALDEFKGWECAYKEV